VTERIKPDARHRQTQVTAKGLPLTKVACWMLPSATLAINTPVLSLKAMLLLDLRGNSEPRSAPAAAGLMSAHAWHFSEPLLPPATFVLHYYNKFAVVRNFKLFTLSAHLPADAGCLMTILQIDMNDQH